jgi:hypothetical protein
VPDWGGVSSRAVEAGFIVIIALAILVGGRNVLVEISRFPIVALFALVALALLELFALRRNVALGGSQARLRVTRDVAFIAAILAAAAFVSAPARWSIGAAIAAVEFGIVLELLARVNPPEVSPHRGPE